MDRQSDITHDNKTPIVKRVWLPDTNICKLLKKFEWHKMQSTVKIEEFWLADPPARGIMSTKAFYMDEWGEIKRQSIDIECGIRPILVLDASETDIFDDLHDYENVIFKMQGFKAGSYSFTGITFNTSCKEIDAICDQTIYRCKYPDMESYLNNWANVQFGLVQGKTPDKKTKIVTLTPQQ